MVGERLTACLGEISLSEVDVVDFVVDMAGLGRDER